MAAYPGDVGSGKVTIAFRNYGQSLQAQSFDSPYGGSPHGGYSPQINEGAKFVDTLAQYTRLVHSSCNSLYQQIKAQSEMYIPFNETNRKQVLTTTQQASEGANKLYQLMEPYSHDQSFILLSEKFKLLVPAVVQFLRCSAQLLFKLNCSPNAQQFQQATEIFNYFRIQLKGAVEQIKILQQNPPLLGVGNTINFQEFVSMCKETKAIQNKISAIALREDPEVSGDPRRAEDVFIKLAGQFVENIKTIIRFCNGADMRFEEETLLDQSNRLIISAKLLFRTSSQHAATLYENDKKAVVESLTTLLLEVQRLSSPRTPSPSRSRSPSPSGRPSSPSLPRQQQYQQQQYQQQQYQQQQQQQQQQRGNILHSTTFSAGQNKLTPPGGPAMSRQQTMVVGGQPRGQTAAKASAEKKKEEEEYKPHLRAKLVNEIIDTEKGYVASLGLVKAVFMVQMKNVKWLKPEEFSTLFANLDDIVKLNSALLQHLLDKCKETGDDLSEACIGALFVEEADKLVAYAKYVNNFDNSLKILELLSSRKAANAFFQSILEAPPAGGQPLLDIGSYLIMPVQRLPRYELLLRELRKFTPKSHPDSAAIDVAMGKMKVVNAKINELKREEENRVKWNNIKESLTADKMFSAATGELVPGINKSRWVFNEGSLDVALLKKLQLKKGTQTEKIQRKTKMQVFLFDDMILFTEPKRGKFNIKYYVIMDCDNVSAEKGEKDSISLIQKDIISGYTYEYIITCPDAKETTSWFRGMTNAINTSMAQ